MSAHTTVNVMEKINEEIRQRYTSTSIIKKAFDNDVITSLGKNNFKLLKRFSTYLNPNLLILEPILTNTFPISYNGNKRKTIYYNDIIKKYCTDIIGYDPTTPEGKIKVHSLLDSIAKKNLKLCIVGYGGAMINFLWNTYLLSFISSYNDPIFKELVIFEKECISLTNILRISKPVLLESFLGIHCDENGGLPKIRLIKEEFQLAEKVSLFKRYLEDKKEIDSMVKNNFIFLGAPNFDARILLQDSPFYFLGHANNELEIFYQPQINAELTFESYGSIDVPVLLANIAVGTIKMLEIFNSIELVGAKKTPKPAHTPGESLLKIDYGEIYNLTPSTDTSTGTSTNSSSEW